MWPFSPLKVAKGEVKRAYLALAKVDTLIKSATLEQIHELVQRKECCILSLDNTIAKFKYHCKRSKLFAKIDKNI
jgi:hypothetical protein